MSPLWTDAKLDRMRTSGDDRADEALARILRDDEASSVRSVFGRMDSNDEIPIHQVFPVLADFFEQTREVPPDVDHERVALGSRVFREHAFEGGLALLCKSLPEGFQAPNLSIVLNLSGLLRTHTYKRLLATLQTVVSVASSGGFEHGGQGVITAQKLRLLHAGVRHLLPRFRPAYRERYGVPINQEDMLGTIMGFSLLVIEGWRAMDLGVTREQEEAYLYLWLVFARLMDVAPPGDLPADLDEATAFYRAYERRHYVDLAENPDGVALALANLGMIRTLIPAPLRALGFGTLPRICMRDLMGDGACDRLGIADYPGDDAIKSVLYGAMRIVSPRELSGLEGHQRLGMLVFRNLIRRDYGEVTFTVPTTLRELRGLIAESGVRYTPTAQGPA